MMMPEIKSGALLLLSIMLGLSGCGSGDSSEDSSESGSNTSSSVSSSTSSSSSAAAESWNTSTGANTDDLVENHTFSYTVSVALDTMEITTSTARIQVGSASGGVTPIMLDDEPVITVTEDSYGVTLDADDMPNGEFLEFALSGSYGKTVTIYSSNKFKLSLNGVDIDSSDGPAINVQSGKRVFVVLGDGTSNVLSDNATWSDRTTKDNEEMDLKATFFGEGSLLFSGSGSLTITASTKHAIASDDHVRIRDGIFDLVANEKDGIHANDAFIMDGGELTIETASGAGKGIKVEGAEDDEQPLGFIAINDGALTINSYDKAITASWESDEDGETTTTTDDPDPLVTINGGDLTINTFGAPYEDHDTSDGDDSLSPEGIESKSMLTINDGVLEITTPDDGLNAAESLYINGGYLYVKSSDNDAVDANGPLTITGGVMVAIGARQPEGALDSDNYTFAVTGGTFIGLGGSNSSVSAGNSTQNVVNLSNGLANTLLSIKEGGGNVAFAFTIPQTTSSMLLSSPDLVTGTSYSVYTGGTIGSYDELFHGMYLGPASQNGGTISKTFTISSRVTTP